MRVVFLVVLLMVSFSVGAVEAVGDGNELLAQCDEAMNISNGNFTDAAFCTGYIAGVREATGMHQYSSKTRASLFCTPDGVTTRKP